MASTCFDITVLGGGIFGLSAAYACAGRGASVRVVERRRIGGGASGGLLGVLAPYAPDKWNAKKAFQYAALGGAEAFWADVAEASGLDPGYARVGRFQVCETEAERVRAAARLGDAEQNWPDFRMWQAGEACGVEAELGGVADDLTGRIHPRKALAALAAAARGRGVRIDEGVDLPLEAARSASGAVVVAAGYECAALLPGHPACGQGVKGEAALLGASVPDDMPVITAPGFFVVGHPGAGVAVGSTAEREWSDPHGTGPALDALVQRARALVPALRGAQVMERWAGIRPRARHPDPVLGEVEEMPGVWLFSGGYGIGFGIGPALGEALAGMLKGQTPDVPPRFLVGAHV